MCGDRAELFERLDTIFRMHPGTAIDQQTELSEMLSIVQVVFGDKPAFLANTGLRGRKALYEEIVRLVEVFGIPAGLGSVDIHHRYRKMRIQDAAMAAVIAERSIDPQPIAWITRHEPIVGAFRAGSVSHLDDTSLLGYPACCTAWHYDCFFARGTEAFCDVHRQVNPKGLRARDYLRREWRPASGFFLPADFFKAAVLRGNARYPFVDHVACPACLGHTDSPTARMDAEARALAEAVAPGRSRQVLDWARSLPGSIDLLVRSPIRIVENEMQLYNLDVRAQDTYRRHGRHLVDALGFPR